MAEPERQMHVLRPPEPPPPEHAGTSSALAGLVGQGVRAARKLKDEACEVCGAMPHPLAVGPGTVYVRCSHMLAREDERLALEERRALRDVIEKKLAWHRCPKKFQGRKLADVKLEIDGVKLHGMAKALPVVAWYLEHFDKPVNGEPDGPTLLSMGAGMFLHGQRGVEPGDGLGQGTGKTMLSAIVAEELRDRGYVTAWFKVKAMCDQLADYSEGTRRMQVLEIVERADLLVLDELIDEKDTAKRIREFIRIVDMRTEQRKPMIVTSNFDTAWIKGQFEAILEADLAYLDAPGAPEPEKKKSAVAASVMMTRFMSRFQPPHFRRIALPGPDVRGLERENWGPAC